MKSIGNVYDLSNIEKFERRLAKKGYEVTTLQRSKEIRHMGDQALLGEIFRDEIVVTYYYDFYEDGNNNETKGNYMKLEEIIKKI